MRVPNPEAAQQSKQGKSHQFSLEKTLSSTHRLHLTAREGLVCPVHCQALTDGRTGSE